MGCSHCSWTEDPGVAVSPSQAGVLEVLPESLTLMTLLEPCFHLCLSVPDRIPFEVSSVNSSTRTLLTAGGKLWNRSPGHDLPITRGPEPHRRALASLSIGIAGAPRLWGRKCAA